MAVVTSAAIKDYFSQMMIKIIRFSVTQAEYAVQIKTATIEVA